MKGNQKHCGFTLAEIIIATMVTVIAVSMCMVGFVYILKSYNQMDTQQELDTEVQNSMERLKYDLRLSTLDNKLMFFYPQGTQTHTAISFPLSGTNGAGGTLCDANGKIIWTKTIIYHVKTSTPNELLKTTFNPSPTNLTADQYQQQLNYVVTNGNGYGTFGGSHATTDVLFINLLNWSISEQPGIFDGYSTSIGKDSNTLGSIVISNGWHQFQFTTVGRNTNSSGYVIGLDTLNVSPSYCIREAETQSVIASSGATPVWRDMSSVGSWNNSADLYFPATATNQSFTLSMYNDVWEDTTFGGAGELYNDGVNLGTKTTTLYFDTNMSPKDWVIKLSGGSSGSNGYAWYAYEQCQDASITGETSGLNLTGRAVRVLIRGGQVTNGGWILHEGSRCRVNFVSGTNPLAISGACIAKSMGGVDCSPDAQPGTKVNLTFGGSASTTISAMSNVWSDFTNMPIYTTNCYLVSYYVATNGTGWKWAETNWVSNNVPGCWFMTSNAIVTNVSATWTNDTWTTFATADTNGVTSVVPNQYVRGVQWLDVSYISNGYYQSQIFDTQCTNPVYHQMTWTANKPTGTQVGMEIRTGNNSDLSDALAWTSSGFSTVPPWPMGAGGRYAQFRAQLTSDSSCLTSPELQSMTVDWPGNPESVDIGGIFTRGTNYGVWQVLVDGQTLKRGIVLSLQIYKWARSTGGGSNLMSSSLTSEIQPWNTGR